MDINRKHSVSKADIIFLFAVFAVAAAIFLILRLNVGQGDVITVSYDGTQVLQLPLRQEDARYYLVQYQDGINIKDYSEKEWRDLQLPDADFNAFSCCDGEIRMLGSSCPDKICVHHVAISHKWESIICLPHKLVIEVEAVEESDLDGVAY